MRVIYRIGRSREVCGGCKSRDDRFVPIEGDAKSDIITVYPQESGKDQITAGCIEFGHKDILARSIRCVVCACCCRKIAGSGVSCDVRIPAVIDRQIVRDIGTATADKRAVA